MRHNPIRYKLRPPEFDNWGGADEQDHCITGKVCCKPANKKNEWNISFRAI